MRTTDCEKDDIVTTSFKQGWKSLAAEARICRSPGVMEKAASFESDVIILHHEPAVMLQRLADDEQRVAWRQGDMIVIPRGVPIQWQWQSGARTTVVAITRNESNPIDPLPPAHVWRDEFTRRILGWIDIELREDNPRGLMFIDALQLSLDEHLRAESSKTAVPPPLDHHRFLTVIEFLNDCIEDRLTLGDLGEVTGLDRFQLQRGFKARTGLAPYAYLLELRARRAVHLVRTARSQPLADIAAQCGFSDQAHMTRIVKRLVGATPGQLRTDN